LGVLFAVIVYNYTEATFKNIHLVWTFFYLIAIDYPAEAPAASETMWPLRSTRRDAQANHGQAIRLPEAAASTGVRAPRVGVAVDRRPRYFRT
jgi:hypothetical protein